MRAQEPSTGKTALALIGFFAVFLTLVSIPFVYAALFGSGGYGFTDADPGVNARAAYNYGFGNEGTNGAIKELIELLKDTRQTSFTVKVWEGSAPPPPELKPEPFGPGVHYYSLETIYTTPAAEAAKALTRVTNQNFGQNYNQWANWFYNEGHNQPTGTDLAAVYLSYMPIVTVPLAISIILYFLKPWKKKR